jgi:hypothetical protein
MPTPRLATRRRWLPVLLGSTLLQAPLSECATFGLSPFGGPMREETCLDFWSLMHFFSGYQIGSYLGPDRLAESSGLLAIYEGAEPHFWPDFAENDLNQRCDVVVGTFGAIAANAGE